MTDIKVSIQGITLWPQGSLPFSNAESFRVNDKTYTAAGCRQLTKDGGDFLLLFTKHAEDRGCGSQSCRFQALGRYSCIRHSEIGCSASVQSRKSDRLGLANLEIFSTIKANNVRL
jgi:hypothetical protein